MRPWEELVRRELDFGGVVEVPVFLGGHERQVGFGETNREEERLLLLRELTEGSDGEGRICAIGKGVVGRVGAFEGGTA